jgi:DNA helicase-2/ATP-dependent DNA helicase PcrA
MKAAARRIVDRYVDAYAHDLEHVWAVERPFELHLDDAVVSGRADVILDVERDELTLVDYKVSVDNAADHELQLRVYTEAGRLEGLVVTGAYLHDLKAGDRIQVDVTPQSIATSNAIVRAAIVDLRARRFTPRPGPICGRCDVREMCRHAV